MERSPNNLSVQRARATVSKVHELRDDDLFLLQRKMEDMLETPGWAELQALLEAHADALLAGLIHGGVQEQVTYAKQTGIIVGLEQVRVAPLAIIDIARERMDAAQAELAEAAEEYSHG